MDRVGIRRGMQTILHLGLLLKQKKRKKVDNLTDAVICNDEMASLAEGRGVEHQSLLGLASCSNHDRTTRAPALWRQVELGSGAQIR